MAARRTRCLQIECPASPKVEFGGAERVPGIDIKGESESETETAGVEVELLASAVLRAAWSVACGMCQPKKGSSRCSERSPKSKGWHSQNRFRQRTKRIRAHFRRNCYQFLELRAELQVVD